MNWLRRFMTGRYGTDELNLALTIGYILLLVVGQLTGWWYLSIACILLCAFVIYRMFSKRIYQRQKENAAFLRFWNPIKRAVSQWIFRRRDRTHRYLRCKKCKERLRLPRGKGSIEVTCPKCRERFVTKT